MVLQSRSTPGPAAEKGSSVGIHVALNHKTSYHYDRRIALSAQVVRLRPAPHCRTPILSYSMTVTPKAHFINWQQDPFSNYLGRLVFPEKTDRFEVEVDLVADMIVINPFDFFLEPDAETFPFGYEPSLKTDLGPYLAREPAGEKLKAYLATIDRSPRPTIDFFVDLNQQLSQAIKYLIRMEPNVQSCEKTLTLGSGSCRDSAWLMVNILRHLGLAARFVSGYLIQLTQDVKSLDGPSGPEADFTDLHAWTEVYLPGAGWVGMDPTSGLFAGEGHIPLACSPEPQSAAPITGALEKCEVDFSHTCPCGAFSRRPGPPGPIRIMVWSAIVALGDRVDRELETSDVRLTMGGEPTFVSIDNMDGAQWNTEALGEEKRQLSESLIKALREQWAPGGLLHYGQGKWYPGESLPRWALGCYWRTDGKPVWRDDRWIADTSVDYGFDITDAKSFIDALAENLGVSRRYIRESYEDVLYYLHKEQRLPVNVDPADPKLDNPEERARMAAPSSAGWGRWSATSCPCSTDPGKAAPGPSGASTCSCCPATLRPGLRLPLESLPWVSEADFPP
jgi:transglutaminase-like putative cysteine protease